MKFVNYYADWNKTVLIISLDAPNSLHVIKVNESRYIALFVVSGSIEKLLPIYNVNIYLCPIFFLPHTAYTVIH